MAVGSCFMQVPPWGTGKDWSELGLGNGQLQGWADQRTPITVGLCFMYTPILVGLCLPWQGMGCPQGPHAWDVGAVRGTRRGLTFLSPALGGGKGG